MPRENKKEELNYSKIKSYLFCPRLYEYIYEGGRYSPYNAQSCLGVSLHRTLAEYGKRGGDFSDIMLYYDRSWKTGGYSTPREEMEYYNMGSSMLESFWLRQQSRNSKILLCEADFSFPFGKWLIRGSIDRIDRLPDGRIEIIDYKVGFEGDPDFGAAGSLQLGIYALGARKGLNLGPGIVSYWFLKSDKIVSAEYLPDGEEKIFSLFREIGEKILASDYGGERGDCAKCAVSPYCRYSAARKETDPA